MRHKFCRFLIKKRFQTTDLSESHPSFYEKVIEYTIKLWKDMESYWNNLGENSELDLKN
ncbi:hypothetical protein RhiirC2_724894 [Rhizophagus irregularis]|uniref:Uncharacterized protein n=1 Tax=Rhizophagus irregularis TaxID=588596 RepID=A0A2N1P2C1_9GLOM|nr:hypothetical protein RhiirC2_724894 [Rhizophagus irregularis]